MKFEINAIYAVYLIDGKHFAAMYTGIENGMLQFESSNGTFSQHLIEEIASARRVKKVVG